MKTYEVRYSAGSSTSVNVTRVQASSASQAKEQIKARHNGNVKIVSAVEK